MAYCENCGNEVADAIRFCTTCGAAVSTPPSQPSPQTTPTGSAQSPPQGSAPPIPPQPPPGSGQTVQAGLDIANNWGLYLVAAGLLMGLIAMFIGWTGSANGIDFIKDMEWFEDNGSEWWLGLLALLGFAGVGLLGFTLVGKVIPEGPIPNAPGIGALGALMLALCPLFTHVGFWLWVGIEFNIDPGDVWDRFWESDGTGIWLALAAGIIAFIGITAVPKRDGRSFLHFVSVKGGTLMTTVPCSNCGRDCSTDLIVCPDCNTPISYQGGTSVDSTQLPEAPEDRAGVIIRHFCGRCDSQVEPDSRFCVSCGASIAPASGPAVTSPVTPPGSHGVSPEYPAPAQPSTWTGQWRVARADTGLGMFLARVLVWLSLLVTGSLAYPLFQNWYFGLWTGRLLIAGRSVRYTGTVGGLFGMWLKTLFFSFITLGLYWLIRGSGNASRYLDDHLELA